jgi:hypothetical protein
MSQSDDQKNRPQGESLEDQATRESRSDRQSDSEPQDQGSRTPRPDSDLEDTDEMDEDRDDDQRASGGNRRSSIN